jgi:hypothetical protein
MFLTVATTAGLVIWLVLWSIGAKAFDAFMITAVVVLVAATVKILLPSLPGNRTE